MPLNDYVTLGSSGLRVSRFCLGAMTFGEEWGWGSSVQEAETIMARFIERGGNFIDTAHDRSRRDRIVLATKFFTNMYPGDPNGGGASRKSLMAACEESLRRLRTDYIDLYWMHLWDKFTPVEETMRALDDLVRSGKVRYIGFSDTPAWKVAQAQLLARFSGWTPLVALQIEGELIPMARELGLGVTPWGALRGGALSGKYTRQNAATVRADRGERVTAYLNERTYTIVDELQRISRELETTPAAVALAWVQAQPGVASTIIGARRLQQLDDNLAALDLKLDASQRAALDRASEPTLPFPVAVLRGASSIMHGGATVNGEASKPWPMIAQAPRQARTT
jgi:aryl-alcohol dehydrogenase-like predicted oxidoreductase